MCHISYEEQRVSIDYYRNTIFTIHTFSYYCKGDPVQVPPAAVQIAEVVQAPRRVEQQQVKGGA